MTSRTVEVLSILEIPTAQQRDDADDRDYAERLFWLVWSLKRGQGWTDFEGHHGRDPAEFIASVADMYHAALATDRVLVPIPRSRLTTETEDDEWPGLQLAKALHDAGAGRMVSRCLTRHEALTSSSSSGERNSIADHVRTMACRPLSERYTPKVTLVDDAITEGTQIAGAYDVLRAAGYTDIMAVTGGAISHDHVGKWSRAKRNVTCCVTWSHGQLRGQRL